MDKWLKQREELLANAKSLIADREKANQSLSDEDRTELKSLSDQIDEIDDKIAAAKSDSDLVAKVKGIQVITGDGGPGAGSKSAKRGGESKGLVLGSLGQHAVDEIFAKHGSELKATPNTSFHAPEFKAPENQVIGDWEDPGEGPILTQYDRSIIRRTKRERPVIADLLGSGRLGSGTNAISYMLEDPLVEGGFGMVPEGGAKPQISFGLPSWETDAARKIAGWIRFSDEFVEDLAFLKTEIDERLLYMLAMREEAQILNGTGVGQNLLGLLNRSGVQTEVAATAADNADAVFRAMTKISTATELSADGIAIHPLDYQKFRLSKDANGQYFGGGFFEGQYGNGGGLAAQPPLWGLRTVVTPAVAVGSPLVGAFRQAATLYRKGGLRVDATNSHVDDFTNNLVTVRVEERVALAVRQPAGIVKLTLA